MSNSDKVGFYSFSYTLRSEQNLVNIPVSLNFKVKKVKIRTVSYTTADNNSSYFMLVSINNFASNSMYITGSTPASIQSLTPYTLYVPLNAQQLSQNIYLNRYPDSWDIILDESEGLSNFNIICLINGTYSGLVSNTYPVFIEILVSK